MNYLTVSNWTSQCCKVCFLVHKTILFMLQLYVDLQAQNTKQWMTWTLKNTTVYYVVSIYCHSTDCQSSDELWLACCQGGKKAVLRFYSYFLGPDTGISESAGSCEMTWLPPRTLIKSPKWAWKASKRAQRWRNREGVGRDDSRHQVSDVLWLRAVTFPEQSESVLSVVMLWVHKVFQDEQC